MGRTRLMALGIAVVLGLGLLPAAPISATSSSSPATVPFTVRGSVHQVHVTGATPATGVELHRGGYTVQSGTTDDLGGYLFRNVDAGSGYTVLVGGPGGQESPAVRVLSAEEVPPQSLYSGQHLAVDNVTATSGYGYLTTRDGTTLSVSVVLPGPADQGPYPAVVEYSGYDPSSPTTGQPQYKLLAPAIGMAWVGVNMRGTGCSGGAYNFFENLQSLDGYDAIETVAAQPWSTGRVGMVGISFAGISQLFVARSQPPHLTAITPLSVIDDTWRGTLYPGGIYNDGFAKGWAQERLDQNKWPNPNPPAWVKQRIDGGDTQCADNMLLRGQNVDLQDQTLRHPFFSALDPQFRYDFPNGGDSLAPQAFVKDITAPVFISGAWQDEQTGGRSGDLLDRFAPTTKVRAVMQNGVHTESLDPTVLAELIEFLDFYVAQKVPTIPLTVRMLAPAIWQAITGVPGLTLPPDRFNPTMDFATARAQFESDPPVRINWEVGNAPGAIAGAPIPSAQTRYAAWPIPGVHATAWYFQPGGRLGSQPRNGGAARQPDRYRSDPSARPRTSYTGSGDGIWRANPTYDWQPVVDGKSLSYISAPLAKTVSMAGTGSVDLWVKTTRHDADVQVTLSEVRPDGTERYVQNGWLRLSHRKLDPTRSTKLAPFHTDTEADARPVPKDSFVKARVQIFPFAYSFRAGSQIRLTIEAPGGDRPLWTFATSTTTRTVTVAHDQDHPSRVVLPVLPVNPDLQAAPAPCPTLRAEPCRTYVEPAHAARR
ncbi:MAG: CocE/NonD family hydrolase [Acidimicrobiia bacterium]